MKGEIIAKVTLTILPSFPGTPSRPSFPGRPFYIGDNRLAFRDVNRAVITDSQLEIHKGFGHR